MEMVIPEPRQEDLMSELSQLLELANPTPFAKTMILFKNNITVTPQTVLADLVEADFDGYGPVAILHGNIYYGRDIASGNWFFQFKANVGDFTFQTSGITGLPQTIYGYAVVDAATIVAVANFDNAITLTAAFQSVYVPLPRILMPAQFSQLS